MQKSLRKVFVLQQIPSSAMGAPFDSFPKNTIEQIRFSFDKEKPVSKSFLTEMKKETNYVPFILSKVSHVESYELVVNVGSVLSLQNVKQMMLDKDYFSHIMKNKDSFEFFIDSREYKHPFFEIGPKFSYISDNKEIYDLLDFGVLEFNPEFRTVEPHLFGFSEKSNTKIISEIIEPIVLELGFYSKFTEIPKINEEVTIAS